jgi:hypothetical protein
MRSEQIEERRQKALQNLHDGVYDPLNSVLHELHVLGSRKGKLRKSQKRKIKKLAKKATKEFT